MQESVISNNVSVERIDDLKRTLIGECVECCFSVVSLAGNLCNVNWVCRTVKRLLLTSCGISAQIHRTCLLQLERRVSVRLVRVKEWLEVKKRKNLCLSCFFSQRLLENPWGRYGKALKLNFQLFLRPSTLKAFVIMCLHYEKACFCLTWIHSGCLNGSFFDNSQQLSGKINLDNSYSARQGQRSELWRCCHRAWIFHQQNACLVIVHLSILLFSTLWLSFMCISTLFSVPAAVRRWKRSLECFFSIVSFNHTSFWLKVSFAVLFPTAVQSFHRRKQKFLFTKLWLSVKLWLMH